MKLRVYAGSAFSGFYLYFGLKTSQNTPTPPTGRFFRALAASCVDVSAGAPGVESPGNLELQVVPRFRLGPLGEWSFLHKD
jgi:hypothetical protein